MQYLLHGIAHFFETKDLMRLAINGDSPLLLPYSRIEISSTTTTTTTATTNTTTTSATTGITITDSTATTNSSIAAVSSSPHCGRSSELHIGPVGHLQIHCIDRAGDLKVSALAVLCRAGRQRPDWFEEKDAAISNLLAEKNRLHKAFFNAPPAKAVYGLAAKGTAPLLSADGCTASTERTQILQQWTENFKGVLSRLSTISEADVARLSQVETDADLDLPPSIHETMKAVQQLSRAKAPESDAILAEINKHGSPQLMSNPTVLFQEM
nr:unnamed protein product [Spirometra erinaceieuropaei]